MLKNVKELKQLLEDKINENEVVIITPHKGPDCDAIGGSLAVYLIVRKMGKTPYILLEDKVKVEHAVKCILEELPESVSVITPDMLSDVIEEENTMLVTADTNKKSLVPINENDYSVFKDVILIDHHDTGEDTIECTDMYIDTEISSVSEIMCKLLDLFQLKYENIDVNNPYIFNIANYLLAGINLDTSKFTKKVTSSTMKAVAKLMHKGADLNYVNDLFLDDFERDCLFMDLVRTTTWKLFNIAIAVNNENPNFIYEKEDLARAADWLMRYKTSDAAFAIGLVDENAVYISGRSKGIVDVGEIMTQLGGGGNAMSGATRIESNDVKAIKLRLDDVIRPGYKIKDRNQ